MAIGKSGSVLVMVAMMWFLLVRMHRSASLPRGNEFWLEILVVEHGGEHGRDLVVHTGDGVDLHVALLQEGEANEETTALCRMLSVGIKAV
jgi:hypothetical protein